HPHIVGVLDVGVIEGQHYFTSEFIEGSSLYNHLKGAAPLRQRVGWIRSIADALAYAHAQGVVHRDVKPENILIDAKGRPFITDFGLAKQVQVGDSWAQDVPALTVSGALLGTPAYLSPEQASGRIELITPSSDQFALGTVLYQLLAQKLPFDEVGLRDQLNAVMTKDPLAPSRVNPSVHRDLDAIVLKSMEKDPARRYPDIGEMAADLGRWLDGEPIRARPVAWLGRSWRKAKRNRAVAALAAGLAVSTILGIGVVAWFAVLPRMREAAMARELAEARSARRQEALDRCAQARRALDAGRPDEAAGRARAVIDDGAPYAAQGEDLPIGEAHVVLGQVARAKGEPSRALAEFYRAFEAGLGTPGEAAALVLVAGQLAEMGEDAQAARLFERALDTRPSPRDAYLARRGLALAALVEGRFDLARRRFLDLGDPAEASAAERAERGDLLDFVSVLSGTTRIPLSRMEDVFDPAFFDLDGDRVVEAATIAADRRSVVVFRLDGGEAKEACRVRVLGDEPFGLTHVRALDLDGDGRAELVVGGGRPDPPGGMLAVLAVRDGRPVVVARAPLASSLAGSPFAAGDLDGDGAVELLVGTAVYERSLRVYRCDLARGSLDLLSQTPLGGDVAAVLTRRTGDRGEVWAFAGAWSTFGLVVLDLDASTRSLVERERLPLAEDYHVDPTLFAEGGEVLLGLGWSEMAAASVPFTVGRRRFEAAYRAPGAWRVGRSDSEALAATPFESMRPGEAWGGTGDACVLRGKAKTWALTAVPVASADGMSFPLAGTRVWRREG
ncbi:MAG: protein kinase, partial [Planctomycetota bacterium]